MFKAFKYRLYPSRTQVRLLEQTLETCRRWYNTCLAERKDAWEGEQRSVGKFEQLAKVKTYRMENLSAGEIHSHILQVVTADLDKAFQAFFRRVMAGETPGYPRFRGRDRFDSFGFNMPMASNSMGGVCGCRALAGCVSAGIDRLKATSRRFALSIKRAIGTRALRAQLNRNHLGRLTRKWASMSA